MGGRSSVPHPMPVMEGEDTYAKNEDTSVTNASLRAHDEDWRPLSARTQAHVQVQLIRSIPIFRKWPYVDAQKESPKDFAERFLAQPEAYSWSLDFSCDFFCELAYEGFLSTSTEFCLHDLQLQVLLPWNDPCRNTLDWRDVHISKQVRKRAKRYVLTVDTAYDEVMLGCIRMHGEAWLFRGLRWLLRNLFRNGYLGKKNINVGAHSFELWEKGKLVAGDLGYTVGGVYTSMTGFRQHGTKGAGEVQLVLTASMLHKMGYTWWDLGMAMKYKAQLGAKVAKRPDFVRRLHENRNDLVVCQHRGANGQDLLKHLIGVVQDQPTRSADAK